MGESSENKPNRYKKRICIGILAHVDAGKTTLAESLLYLTGEIRKVGRVDHRDAFLDTEELEKARGITIFSKQAVLDIEDTRVTLLDTPGHVDFSAEMERTLQVMDYAILVISGADGIQGHVETLWRLLNRYEIPVFLFVNKMDQAGTDREKLYRELQERLDEHCIDFSADVEPEVFAESIAMCDEGLLEDYLETGSVEKKTIAGLISERRIFPCFFGSALRIWGVQELLDGIRQYTLLPGYPEEFGARVYKISRDSKGERLTHMKVTGGVLRARMLLKGKSPGRQGENQEASGWEEKVNQIRIYSGASYTTVSEAPAGTICAVTGLAAAVSGEGLGIEKAGEKPVLEPVLTYRILLPPDSDIPVMLGKLKQLEEEIPELHIVWDERLGEIHAQVMGDVQIEILKSMIRERFGTVVEFGSGNIVYKETIRDIAEGVGHFEPLRHYAEVHLRLEPGEPGSGLQFETECSEDDLDRNWQRLILTHLEERKHPGVLAGCEITDMRITLTAGRAHIKHTEGGDFRQATYRAVRQGLKKAKSVLLEPVYDFRLEIPSDVTGRALNDIQRMYGTFLPPEQEGDLTVITGSAPVVTMRDYQREVTAYTRGRGRLSCTLKGYEPCHNEEEVLLALGYDSEADTENPTGSVFCAHGAGFVVSWDKVEEYMHLESTISAERKEEADFSEAAAAAESMAARRRVRQSSMPSSEQEAKELEEIFTRTYGPVKRKKAGFERKTRPAERPVGTAEVRKKQQIQKNTYLLVDGYNIIFSWDELKELAKDNVASAREKLMDILSNYQGYKQCTVILVFDAYRVKNGPGAVQKYHNIFVVYTKEAETADQYIEKTVHEIGRQHQVTVATSDGLEQIIIMGQGAVRLSARDLKAEVEAVNGEMRELFLEKYSSGRNYLLDHVTGDVADFMKELQKERGKQRRT